MADRAQGADLFIVDNADDQWKVQEYLREWADIAHTFDVATGYFEIGALLALDGQWQKLDKLRILMGDEVTRRTRQALVAGIEQVEQALDVSIEREKEGNDFLHGVPAVVAAMQKRRIECRVYAKEKFHAKAYITHGRNPIVGSSALVGSSNFTGPGLSTNIELNVQLRHEVELLQEWYEKHWDKAEDITAGILQVIERHTREYTPFEVYAKALQQFFRGHELTAGEWENTESEVFPKLDQYQREGYEALIKIARKYGGAFLCDGVGLGKTFIGLMVIERLVQHERKRVALFVPKSARTAVWEPHLKKYLPSVWGGKENDFSNLVVFSHTDLLRGGDYPDRLKRIKEMADAIVIDEAHNFRNTGVRAESAEERQSRYWQLYDICAGKQLFMLTATPVNNRLLDLQHVIELFSQQDPGHFKGAPLGIHSLPGYFRKLDKELDTSMGAASAGDVEADADTDQVQFEKVLGGKELFREIVVQRSRSYVQESQRKHGGRQTIFPVRQDPQVVDYSVSKTYGPLLDLFEKAFNKKNPLFTLPMYYPLYYYIGDDPSITAMDEGRQKQVVRLIRLQFLKRFESSPKAFGMSCGMLLKKLLAFVTKNSLTDSEKANLERWKQKHADLLGYVRREERQLEFGDELDDEEELEDDILSPEFLEMFDELCRDEFRVAEMLTESLMDLEEVADFLEELQKLKPKHDDKLQRLLRLLKTDPVLKEHKVIIFSEYVTTARYLRQQMEDAGIVGLDQVDSLTKKPRDKTIWQFAPYYNELSSGEVAELGEKETRVLISTDVLSEGLNLQDATRLINYDLHWNPVRLMQRIGRVDRRLNPDIEERILADHPDQKAIRQTVAFWNFLPPEELNRLLSLYTVVTQKTLRISKTFGIEGKKLLTKEDNYEALQDFIQAYEGTTTPTEEMHLEFQQLLIDQPDLVDKLDALPGRVFSGKKRPEDSTDAVFFCYALPAPGLDETPVESPPADAWTEELGSTSWYLYQVDSGDIADEPSRIIGVIRCAPNTPRHRGVADETLSDIRAKVEKHIKNSYLKRVNAPVGVKPILKCWMELSRG